MLIKSARTKSRPEKVADKPPPAPPPSTVQPGGKLAVLLTLLRRPEGTTLAALADATGWKPQSVRGAMAGALKARGHVVSSAKTDGVRIYRLPSPAAGDAA